MIDCPKGIRHDMQQQGNGHYICKNCGYHVDTRIERPAPNPSRPTTNPHLPAMNEESPATERTDTERG